MITLTNICTEFCDNLCRAVFVGLNFVLKPCSLCSVQDFQLRPINMCLYRVHKYKHKSTRTHTHSGRQAKGKIASNTQTNTEIFYCASSKKKKQQEKQKQKEKLVARQPRHRHRPLAPRLPAPPLPSVSGSGLRQSFAALSVRCPCLAAPNECRHQNS